MLAFVVAAQGCRAAEEPARVVQERIKAAVLYKIAAYVEWPREAVAEPRTPPAIAARSFSWAGATRAALRPKCWRTLRDARCSP